MRDVYTLVFSVSAVLLGIEIIARLFPEKSAAFVQALAVLAAVLTLMGGLLHADWSWLQQASSVSFEENTKVETLYAETGTALLRERLRALLESSGIAVADADDGVEIWYTKGDDGAIDIDRVRVSVEYATDIDRAYAVLNAALTDAIPVEVFAR